LCSTARGAIFEGSNMGFLTERQWRQIESILPQTRRDRLVIEAILYREFSGQSLAEVAEVFALTKVRLHQWHHAIAAELPQIMATLRLERASASARCRSGSRPTYRDNPAMVAAVGELRLRKFRQALRGGGR
jgi:hypothetical protein